MDEEEKNKLLKSIPEDIIRKRLEDITNKFGLGVAEAELLHKDCWPKEIKEFST